MFTLETCRNIQQRGTAAASAGKSTVSVPELGAVAERIAADPRVEPLHAKARRWESDGARYHDLVRLAASYVLALETVEPGTESVYVPKASAELEPLLALFPHVLALPTVETLSARGLIALRALSVHPLGVVQRTSWADGRSCSPAEYFFHDLDHARFKVREDLAAIGVDIADAYRDGTTFDTELAAHRVILTEARERLDPRAWRHAEQKAALAEELGRVLDGASSPLAAAAELLLFEIVHEKSHPLVRGVLQRELSGRAHVEKLGKKLLSGFFEPELVPAGALDSLEAARALLLARLG